MISRRVFLGAAASMAAAAGTKQYCGVGFQEIRNGSSKRRYLLIHGDEHTAREVLSAHIKRYKGRAMLVQNATRTVTSGAVQFDPNRMFTRAGLERNLIRLNPQASETEREQIHKLVAKSREKLLKLLTPPPGGLLTVLHNNARGYSVKDELPISNETSLPQPNDIYEFILCTNPADFAILSKSPFNAVLQHTPKGDDDGSLSRIAAARRFRYLNIEAAIGQIDKQRAMLEWVEKNLP